MSTTLTFWSGRDDVDNSRRDFLTRVGFAIAASALTGCSRGVVQKAIPYLNKPEEITPGVAAWYATTCAGCAAGCGLLVKTRDGRPIKIEGNGESRLFGGTCATGQASVLSLYDAERLKGPLWRGEPATWEEIDAHIAQRLGAVTAGGRAIVLLTGTISSPSTRALIAEWTSRVPRFRHVVYDAVSSSALVRATETCFGVRAVPHYRFDLATTIVGIEADFLGTWISPVEFTRQYASGRRPDQRTMSRHYQFEAGVSLTGSNADWRIPVAPSLQGAVALGLLHRIAGKAGVGVDCPADLDGSIDPRALTAAADDLWRHRGASLVVCGSQDIATQVVVHAINALLDNIGATVDVESPSLQKQGDDEAVAQLVDEMNRGDVHALMLYGVNPAYDYPEAARFAQGMASVALTISFAERLDESASLAHAVCPDHHFLEAWNDAEPVTSSFSLAQPTIAPMLDTRAAQDSLLKWLAKEPDFYSYIRGFWRQNIFPLQSSLVTFDAFWDHVLHDGVFDARTARDGAARLDTSMPRARFVEARKSATDAITREHQRASLARAADRYELHLYQTVALRDGRHANNPWLQELPDPLTKVTWGNYVVLAPADARDLHISSGDVVRIAAGHDTLELPAYVQPGQAPRTVSIALGYGRERAGKVGVGVGANAFPLATTDLRVRRYFREGVALEKTGRQHALATTQEHHSMEGRPIVKTTTLAELAIDKPAPAPVEQPSLYAEREGGEHRWGLVIDLNSCTGCSACVTACQAENNVPVVGRDEVLRGREMHWLRIDAYTTGSEEHPETLVQPMMCQHCENAPCETVCPTLATVHSSDGLNQQIYNRCVGTRYCANNCPYKVRRFNWFEYAQNERFDFNMNNPVGRMVLNPDVVVRSRGVMEKCSMCVQRVQAGKLVAKQEGRALADGDIKTACQQVCPAEAIVFGDLNDPGSRAATMRRSGRYYRVLDELGTKPNVGYLMKVRNRTTSELE
jgi:Fe-S-cluster-containing dehydrogenase component